ncbi:MAG: hypothetical protein KJ593_08040 [Candidatus Omnitrophica bacterium]|nr:hypothetical protein [Candidatus Omnitrophota bacterium]
MRKSFIVLITCLVILYVFTLEGSAAIPHLVRYQGYLTDSNNVPLDGSYSLTLRMHDTARGGNLLWSETQTDIQVSSGNFAVLLGQVTPLDIPFDTDYWLSIEVNSDGEMSPRQRISSVPYAYRAEEAENVGGIQKEEIVTISDEQIITGNKTFSGISNFTGALQQNAVNGILLPSGAIFFMLSGDCPIGTTDVTAAYSDKFIRVNATQGARGGADSHDHGGITGNHTLTVNEIPSHRHTMTTRQEATAGEANTNIAHTVNAGNELTSLITASAGGGAGHGHTISSASNVPAYVACKLCQVD